MAAGGREKQRDIGIAKRQSGLPGCACFGSCWDRASVCPRVRAEPLARAIETRRETGGPDRLRPYSVQTGSAGFRNASSVKGSSSLDHTHKLTRTRIVGNLPKLAMAVASTIATKT